MNRKFIKKDGSINFDRFALLNESEQISYMENWTPQQWRAYRMQNTISEEECFGPVLKLIDEIEEGKFNGSSI